MTPAELRAAMRALPAPPSDVKPPLWDAWRYDLWKRVTDGENPARFSEWPCIYHTMLQFHWLDLVQYEVETLYSYPLPLHDLLFPPKNGVFDYLPKSMFSANLVKQLHHIHQWEKTTGRLISDLSTIVEFGAGYGAMPLLVHRLGFKGTYYIIDLPEFSLLQQYYLSNTGEAVNVEWVKPGDDKPKKKSSLFSIPDTFQPDLLIALYSLSEVDYAFRDATLDNIKAKSHLLLFSNRFADYDNVAYFDGYTKRAGGNWRTWVIEHMPPESLYSVGWTE